MNSTEAPPSVFEGVGDTTRKRKRIIFLTSSEYGQANVILAVAYEMLLLQQCDIHVASFSPLKGRVQSLNELVPDNHVPATFHTVFGPSALEALTSKDEFIGPYRPGVRGALKTYRVTLPVLATAWDGPAYMKGYESCLEILRSVEPDLIVIDPLFSQGLEACNTLSRDCVVLSPNTFQEMCGSQQSLYSQLCRYPAISSAFPYPIPWYLVPANILLKVMLIGILVTSSRVRTFMNYRKSQGLPGLPAAFNIWQKSNHYLVQSTPETDYPCYVPTNVTGCGPILLPSSPVSKDDPILQSWLERAPTILINLGTHIRMDDTMAREFASGLKIVLDRHPNLQILWKLKPSGGMALPSKSKSGGGFQGEGIKKEALDAISEEVSSDRVKIMDWMSVSPLAVLQTGHIICSVHHGGSNSFHEALSAGVPQVVLPCWLDTLEFANRVEWLGIGIYGSRSAAPSVEGQELSRALIKVLDDGTDAAQMKQQARKLADISGKVGGRRKALEKIMEVMRNS